MQSIGQTFTLSHYPHSSREMIYKRCQSTLSMSTLQLSLTAQLPLKNCNLSVGRLLQPCPTSQCPLCVHYVRMQEQKDALTCSTCHKPFAMLGTVVTARSKVSSDTLVASSSTCGWGKETTCSPLSWARKAHTCRGPPGCASGHHYSKRKTACARFSPPLAFDLHPIKQLLPNWYGHLCPTTLPSGFGCQELSCKTLQQTATGRGIARARETNREREREIERKRMR